MASVKKKQEEENNLKTLREIVGLPHNKHCFDCNQRGPTYVNMTIGSFVCTACSGLLRGLNPPHRVKSISMASFSSDEMELIKSRGNEYCRKVWLGLYDHKIPFDIDSKDESRMKDQMSQRYEKKRWYVQPSKSLADECRIINTTKQPTTLSTTSVKPSTYRPSSEPSQLHTSPSKTVQKIKQEMPVTQSNNAALDLFSDFYSDPFNKPSTQQQSNSHGFADFANFNTFPQQNSFFSGQNPQQLFNQNQTQMFPQIPNLLQSQQQLPPQQHLPSQQQLPSQQPQLQQQSSSLSAQNLFNTNSSILLSNSFQQTQLPSNSDKYSALIGLSESENTANTSSVDWDGNRRGWMPASHSSTQKSSAHPPPPSYNSLNFGNMSSHFKGLSVSSSTPHFSTQQPNNFAPFYQQANGAVHQFAPYTMNTNWAWMASQASGQNPFASQPPANNNPIITPNNHNNPFL